MTSNQPARPSSTLGAPWCSPILCRLCVYFVRLRIVLYDSRLPSFTQNGMTTAPRASWTARLNRLSNLLGILASLILIASISAEAFSSQSFQEERLYRQIQLWVCVYFLLDMAFLLAFSTNKAQFLARHLFLILLSIPYANILAALPANLSDDTLYLLRFLPLMRGAAALVVLVRIVVSNQITGLFIAYIVTFCAIIYFQTLIFFVVEAGTNPQVANYADALWWAAMTVTTVGSDIIPATAIGKISTSVLAVVGMTTLPIFTVYISALIQALTKRQRRADPDDQAPL